MADNVPQLGKTISGTAFRDCIHVAVAPVTAGEDLSPGERVALLDGKVYGQGILNPIGIVDPFLDEQVKKGERVWILLFPGTITDLRHVWKHPAFSVRLTEKGGIPNG